MNIEALRESAREAKRIADRRGLLLAGGVMGADAMAWLSGFQPVMELSLLRPDVVREYMRVIHEWNMRQLSVYLDVTEAELVIRRAWYETTEFWTPAAYRDIVAPAVAREARLVHQAGRRLGAIVTSAFLPLLDDLPAAGVDVLIGLDPAEGKGTDLRAVKERLRARRKAVGAG